MPARNKRPVAEEWRPVSGHPGYEVSSLGRVRGWTTCHGTRRVVAKVLKPWLRGNQVKYWTVRLYRGKSEARRDVPVHNLVLTEFVGPRPAGFQGCHCDGNPDNNAASNLRWDSRSGNMADMRIHGTATLGSDSHCSKLTEDSVLSARREWKRCPTSWADFGRRYGISAQNMRRAIIGSTWKHVEMP